MNNTMIINKSDSIFEIIKPFFSPGFCEGVVSLIKVDENDVCIFVTNEISKNKIEAIIESDFKEEQNYLKVEVVKI